MAPTLHIDDLARRFGTRELLGGLSVHIEEPGVVGVVGGNGSGKTSLLRIVAGLLRPTRGTVEVCGRRGAARLVVGYVPHEPLAWGSRSVRANLELAARLLPASRHRARQQASGAIDGWGLASLADLPVARLSRGQAQRYALARADLAHPPVLLLDEPTAGLDAASRELLEQALAAWRDDGRLLLVSSHEQEWLAARASRLVHVPEPRTVTEEAWG